jgi:hypothetical protein
MGRQLASQARWDQLTRDERVLFSIDTVYLSP